MTFRCYLTLSSVGVVLSLLPYTTYAAKPNIVVILADDMGYGDVHALNPDSRIPTPNLDGLAAGGMTFTDSHSPSAVCTPTRYGLLTGRYCWRTNLKSGVLGGYSEPLIDADRSTIATMLKSHGYRTGAVGKWHLGMSLPLKDRSVDTNVWDGDPGIDFAGTITDSPVHHGFDSFFGVSASLDMAPYVFVRNDRFTTMPSIQQSAVKFPHFVRQGPRADDFIINEVLDRITEEACSFITNAATRDEPYFLYVPFTAPHKPTQPHGRFRGKTELGEYGDFVFQTDWSVGEILKAVDTTGEADNTLVVFTSDNGSYMYRYDEATMPSDHVLDDVRQGFYPKHHRPNGPFRGTKADIYEAGHHVPFFVRWPAKVAAGSACAETICHTDLFSTFARIVGATLGETVSPDGYPLLDMLMGVEGARRGEAVIHHSVGGMFAIRDGRWKLILGNGSGGRAEPAGKPFGKPYQLFDLIEDIGETKDVAAQNPEVVKRMEQAFMRIHADAVSLTNED